MFKKLLFALLLINPLANGMVVYPEGVNVVDVRQSQKQLALDYHNVLTKQDPYAYYWSWAKALPAMASAAAQLGFSKVTGIQTAPQKALNEIKELPKEVASSGEALITIFNNHGLTGLASFIVNIKNSYKPYQPMVDLLKRVKTHNQSMTMRVASNMGPQIWQNSQASLANNNPFNGLLEQRGQIVDYRKYTPSSQPVTTDQYLSQHAKPTSQFFDSFQNEFNKGDEKVTIFIDDKESNVKAAAARGLVGIHFDRKKENAMTIFEQNLATLGIKVH